MSSADFEARLAAVEAKVLAPTSLADLPLGALKRWLEQNWQPSASSVLESGSITLPLLDGAIHLGNDTLTFPGGSIDSTALNVLHGFDRPATVLTESNALNYKTRVALPVGNTNFSVAARTLDGSSPAAATTVTFDWIAFA